MDSTYEKNIQHQFEVYCKRILRNERIDEQRKEQRDAEYLTSFSEIDPMLLAVYDEYPSDYEQFVVNHQSIAVKDDLIAQALQKLSAKRVEIILMSYYFGFNDREIGEVIGLLQDTVRYQRLSALRQLGDILLKEGIL